MNKIETTQPTREVPLILALDVSGQPREWVTWQKAIEHHCKGLVAWQLGEDDFTFYGGTSRKTGNRTSISTQSIIAIKGLDVGKIQKHAKISPPVSNTMLFRRDRHLCAYCGDQFVRAKLTRDHIAPESKGGKSTWMNLVTACGECNRRKGDKYGGRDDWQLLYVPYVPARSEYLVLSNRSILADQMDFLMASVPTNSRLWIGRDKN